MRAVSRASRCEILEEASVKGQWMAGPWTHLVTRARQMSMWVGRVDASDMASERASRVCEVGQSTD